MERFFEIKDLSEAYDFEEIYAVYQDPKENTSGKKINDRIKKAEADAEENKCRLLVWRETDLDTGYLLTNADYDVMDNKYKNAVSAAKYATDPELIRYEKGKADAFYEILRMIGRDPAERRI